MPVTVIAERVGWPYSIRTLSGRVAEWRPVYLPPDPVSRTSYVAGEIAQCDFWFPPVTLPVGFGRARNTGPVAGADDGGRLFTGGGGAADPLPASGGPPSPGGGG